MKYFFYKINIFRISQTGQMHGFPRFQCPNGSNFAPRFHHRGPSPNQHNFYTPPRQPSPRQQVSYSDMNVFSNGPRRPQTANFGKNTFHSPPNFNSPPPRHQVSYSDSNMFTPNSGQQQVKNGDGIQHQQFNPQWQSPPPRFTPHQQNGHPWQNNRNQNCQWGNTSQNGNNLNCHKNFTSSGVDGFTTNHNQKGNNKKPWSNNIWNNLPKDSNRNPEHFQKKKKPKVDKRDLAENNVYFCDTCDRGFKMEEKYQEHIQSHVKCQHEGCSYTAHPKLVRLHNKTQHYSGLASKIWKLESPEDIEKWRQERRKNFPTAENVQRKKEILEEKRARGEVIETKTFGKMRNKDGKRERFGRGRNQRQNNRKNFSEEDVKKESPPKLEVTITKENVKKEGVKKFDGDPLSMLEGLEEVVPESDKPVSTIGGLAALMANYSDSDEEKATQADTQTNKPVIVDDTEPVEESLSGEMKNKRSRKRKRQRKNGQDGDCSSQPKVRKSTLLEKLLAPDIRRERNLILQCVYHIVKENFFGVGNPKEGDSQKPKITANDKTDNLLIEKSETDGESNVVKNCKAESFTEISAEGTEVGELVHAQNRLTNSDVVEKLDLTRNEDTECIIDDCAWE
ncbi:FMR1-interacting protein NUFIP1-like isoform X2 [Saccostrea cucullata]|uniref:FMR1-interacting protein NUFIP1-like isoform X2 n=1 Tax=Saccostrea cuccullata TaxID=36930 RepID=UPI002ED0096E